MHFVGPVRITADVEHALLALSPLAPLHQPRAVEGMRAIRGASAVTSRRSRASIRHFTRRSRPPRRTRCRRRGASSGGYDDSDSTACRTPTQRRASRGSSSSPTTPSFGSCAATSVPAHRCARRVEAVRSTRRWDGRRSRGSSWRRGRERSTRARCSALVRRLGVTQSSRVSTERRVSRALGPPRRRHACGARRARRRRCTGRARVRRVHPPAATGDRRDGRVARRDRRARVHRRSRRARARGARRPRVGRSSSPASSLDPRATTGSTAKARSPRPVRGSAPSSLPHAKTSRSPGSGQGHPCHRGGYL